MKYCVLRVMQCFYCQIFGCTVCRRHTVLSSSALLQIRRALLQLLFPERPFHWLRHIAIAACLLFVVNMLVILVPNIRDIFGITGEESDGGCDFLSLVVQHSQSSRFLMKNRLFQLFNVFVALLARQLTQ